MMPIRRAQEPSVLLEKGPAWTEAFLTRRTTNPHCAFRWPVVEGQSLNRLLCPELEAMTAEHCAYCDHYQLGVAARETIDHFRPKSVHPELAYTWENLFPACDVCQGSKLEQFDEALLKPDEPDYCFERFFIFNFSTGEIEPCPDGSLEEQNRAEVTIRILGLNVPPRNQARKRAHKQHYRPKCWPIYRDELEQLPYRFLAPPGDGQPQSSDGGQ